MDKDKQALRKALDSFPRSFKRTTKDALTEFINQRFILIERGKVKVEKVTREQFEDLFTESTCQSCGSAARNCIC